MQCLLLPKMSNIKKIKVKSEKIGDESEVKFKDNKYIFFRKNNNNLFEKNKTTCNKIKDLKKTKLGYCQFNMINT